MTSQVFRHSTRDAYLVLLSALHLMALLAMPSIPLIAIGVWWNSNTISHHFLHLPFFRSRLINHFYSLYLSLLLGIPQSIWRDRHLAHHRSQAIRLRWTWGVAAEILLISVLWVTLLWETPRFFMAVYLPGLALGLMLCYLHGYYEHAGGTTSNYGGLYNLTFFNDGYHVEHHANPSLHWTRMKEGCVGNARTSQWPAVLRWIELSAPETLERMAVRSRLTQSFLLLLKRLNLILR
jgi:fatty acid desaturase